MTIMGPKPKPRHLKALIGTLRKDRDRGAPAELEPVKAPAAPSWLPLAARPEFTRLAALLAARGAIGESTAASLGHFVCLGLQLADMFKSGRMPMGSSLTSHRNLARLLRLDEAAADAVPKKVNPFAKFARRDKT